MKKFLFLHYGFEEPTAEIMAEWNRWFESVGDRMLEMGGLGDGFEINHEGTRKLPFGKDSITGFNIIQADSLEAAEKIAAANPFIQSIQVYELRDTK